MQESPRRAGALLGHVPALLRPPLGDYRRAGRVDRLTGLVRRRPPTNAATRLGVWVSSGLLMLLPGDGFVERITHGRESLGKDAIPMASTRDQEA